MFNHRFIPSLLSRYALLLVLSLFAVTALAREKQRVWVIDAGHGGNDHGCETSTAMEKNINLAVAQRVRDLVKENIPNVKVVMTRDADKYIALDKRCEIANNAGAELFLSIHVNAAPEVNTIAGTETFYGPQGGTDDRSLERLRKNNIQKSELLAWMMQKYYGVAGRPISRGVKRERYYVILYTKMPAILTEIGFITTPSEEKYMTSTEGMEEIAQSIYRGLKEYDETVQNDKVQSTLALLRRTGGKAQQNLVPEGKGPEKLTPETLLAQNNATTQQPQTTVATTTASTQPQPTTAVQTTTAGNVFGNNTSGTTSAAAAEPATTSASEGGELAGTVEPEEVEDELLFSVQIFSLRAKLNADDKRFKGLKDLLVVERDGLYKYLCGTTSDYPGARKLLAKVRESFPDAFLVAYKGNMQISMADAIEMLPK